MLPITRRHLPIVVAPTSHNNNDDVDAEAVLVKRKAIQREYTELVQEKFANQRTKVMANITKLREHIQTSSIDTEEGTTEIFRANKAMKVEYASLKLINTRHEKTSHLSREYREAISEEEIEIFEAAMILEIDAMKQTMLSVNNNNVNNSQTTTTTTTTDNKSSGSPRKNKKYFNPFFRKARSQLSLTQTRLEKSYLKLQKDQQQQQQQKKQLYEHERGQEPQDCDTTDSTSSFNSSSSYYYKPDDEDPQQQQQQRSSPTPAMPRRRSVSFSTFNDMKIVPTVLDLLEDHSGEFERDDIWYARSDFCGFAQKEMSRRSELGITSTSALHSSGGDGPSSKSFESESTPPVLHSHSNDYSELGNSDDCDSDINDDSDNDDDDCLYGVSYS